MDDPLTLPRVLSNAFNKDNSAGQAVADLEKILNEATLLELSGDQDSPRFIELQKLTSGEFQKQHKNSHCIL